jgi:hypothetical protein
MLTHYEASFIVTKSGFGGDSSQRQETERKKKHKGPRAKQHPTFFVCMGLGFELRASHLQSHLNHTCNPAQNF